MGEYFLWEKAKIVMQGLKGRAISEICNEYQIHQTQYYKWREQFLENIPHRQRRTLLAARVAIS